MKVIKRSDFEKSIVNNCNVTNDSGLKTFLKVVGAATEIRLEEHSEKPLYKKALVLMGMNIYTVTSPSFVKAVEDNMHAILDDNVDTTLYIKELAADDKRIGKV